MVRTETATDMALAAMWTADRAFETKASIAQDSRSRMPSASDRLGWRPHLLARIMTTEATQQVALLADDFADFTESSVARA